MTKPDQTLPATAFLFSICLAAGAAAHHHGGSADYMQSRLDQFVDRYDTDGDMRVSSIEFEQHRRNRFDITDENADGTVSQDEYVYEWEDRMDAQLEKDRAGQVRQTSVRFGALDRDDDEKMQWAEYARSGDRMFTRWDSNEDGLVDASDPKRERGWSRKTSGKSKSGAKAKRTERKIDPEKARQYRIARMNSMLRMPSTHRTEGFMVRYDVNGDEQVTRAEFDAKRRSDFDKTDEDSNGWVSEQEYVLEYEDRLDMQIAKQREQSIKQAGHRFGALDKDDDGAMTFAEYQRSGHSMFKRWDTSFDGYVSAEDPLPEPRESLVASTDQSGND